jgi:hypothetical protein
MAIFQSQTDSFKVQLLNGQHNFSANTFKIALYTSNAQISNATTTYTSVGEVTGTGYTAGGNTLVVSILPTNQGNTAYLSFANTAWNSSTISASGALIYNTSFNNASVAALSFGSTIVTNNQVFSINFPTAAANTAIIRIS